MNIAVILAGGIGNRTGLDIPKQYYEVRGKPIIAYSLDVLGADKQIDCIQIVAEDAWQEYLTLYLSEIKFKFRGFSKPGENRQLSIYHALSDIQEDVEKEDCILIHDAARPCITSELITRCLKAINGHDGVLPFLPMKDTIYLSKDGRTITSLLDRKQVLAGQAPEVFRFGKYYEANQKLLPDKIKGISGSTEPAILAKLDIATVMGDENNFKITTVEDIKRFEMLLAKIG